MRPLKELLFIHDELQTRINHLKAQQAGLEKEMLGYCPVQVGQDCTQAHSARVSKPFRVERLVASVKPGSKPHFSANGPLLNKDGTCHKKARGYVFLDMKP